MLILIHGADDFSSHEALAELAHQARFEYNSDRFDGTNSDINSIRATSETMPFLSDARLVIVEGLPKPKREKATADEPETPKDDVKPAKGKRTKKVSAASLAREFVTSLAALATANPESTTLAVIVDEELPKTHELVIAAQQHGKVLYFAPPTGATLEKWINQRVKSEGVAITSDAARLLATLAVGNLRILASEINKLATYVGQRQTISVDAIRLLVPDNREARIFDLTDQLAASNRAAALNIMHELLQDGQQPLAILPMITRQIRILLQVKDLAERGLRSGEIAASAGVAPFLVEKTIGQARRFSFAQLESAHRGCLRVDTALKRSRMTPELALDLLIIEFGQTTINRPDKSS